MEYLYEQSKSDFTVSCVSDGSLKATRVPKLYYLNLYLSVVEDESNTPAHLNISVELLLLAVNQSVVIWSQSPCLGISYVIRKLKVELPPHSAQEVQKNTVKQNQKSLKMSFPVSVSSLKISMTFAFYKTASKWTNGVFFITQQCCITTTTVQFFKMRSWT